MKPGGQIKYESCDDKQLVDMILAVPHNDEAAVFLFYNRYLSLLDGIRKDLSISPSWFDECMDELFIHLKGKGGDWKPLASFKWDSSLGTWLHTVARNKFCEIKLKVIEKGRTNVSIDAETVYDKDGVKKHGIQIAVDDKDEEERRYKKIIVLEAIAKLEDDDKFIMIKRLEGYDSKTLAMRLQERWEMHGIVRRTPKGDIVVPSAAYIDNRVKRAKESLKKMLKDII